MKAKHLLSVLSVIGIFSLNAQQVQYCGTDEVRRKLHEQHPELLQTEAEQEAFIKWFTTNRNNFSRDSIFTEEPYIIPVVFHILHDGGVEYLSNDKIFLEIQNMNEFFKAANTSPQELGTNYSNVPSIFRGIVANMNVEFRLARIDPNGNCTNGIDRIYTYATNRGSDDVKLNSWPQDKYLNIWTLAVYPAAGAEAYATFPSDGTPVNNQTTDGLITHREGVGISTQGDYLRPVLAHEAGHWLNLYHTFQDSCVGGDLVDDTPPAYGSTPSVCDLNKNSCNNDSIASNGYYATDVIDNEQNCMNYSGCHYMFTEGQKLRAHAALNSSTGGRNNVWSTANLAATGVEPLSECLPTPKAEFGYSKRDVCVGETVRLIDFTGNTSEWTRSWSFPDDVQGANGNDSIQNISFAEAGWKTISLNSTNESGTSTKSKTTIYVRDNSTPSIPYPYYETFDNSSVLQDWTSINYDNNQTAFTHYNGVGHHSSGCLKLNDYQETYRGDRDEVISPAFDLTGINNENFRFSFDYTMACRFASQIQNNDSTASLEVYITRDCNGAWTKISSASIIGHRKLMVGGALNASYAPGSDDQWWKTVDVDLSSGYSQYKTSDVRFKFVVIGEKSGNNFYLDNFNLGNAETPTAINNPTAIAILNLYPNPATDNTTLLIEPTKEAHFSIDIADMLGKKVLNIFDGDIASQQEISINTAALSKGVYSVQVNSNGKIQQQKFVKL